MLRIVFLLIFFSTSSFQSNPQHQLILSCLTFYKPSLAVFFTCWKRADKVKMHKTILAENLNVRLVFAKPERKMLSKINTKKYEKFSYFLDTHCEQAAEILKEASSINRFGKFEFLYSWYLLGLDQEKNLTDFVGVFQTFKTRMDMNVKIFQAYDEHNFNIYEIFNPGINVGVIIKYIGKLQNGNILLDKNISYYESRKNMTGVLVRSTSVVRYPFKTTFDEYMTDLKLKKYDIYTKFHYQLFVTLAYVHGFSYNTSLEFAWFGNKSSGEDGGTAKLLWEDAADISTGGLLRLLGTERIAFYDYIIPYYKFRSCFYFRNPGIVKPNFKEVLKPFSRQSWIVTLYVTGIVCLCIEITYFVERRNNNIRHSVWFRSIFVVIAAFSQQGLDNIPNRLPGRIIILHLLICSLLLYNYYTSSLVSSLISTEPIVFKTVKELLESKLKVGIEFQPYTITYILDRAKHDRDLRLLNQTKIYEHNTPNIFTAEKGIEKVHQGGFAFHAESITAYPLISDSFEQESICDLAEIVLITSDTSLMIQKKSHYKKLFQITLRKMWQSGIMKKLYKTWVTSKPECLSSTRVISVSINDLFLPCFLLGMGVLASLLILTFETTWKKVQLSIKRKLFSRKMTFTYTN